MLLLDESFFLERATNQIQGEIGMIGVGIISSGIVGALITGTILDRTKAYREIYWCSGFFMIAGFTFITFTLQPNNYIMLLVSACVTGAGAIGALPVIFEVAVEITFPVPEGTSTGK